MFARTNTMPRVGFQVAQVFQVAGVREHVDVDQQVVRTRAADPAHVRRADEAGAAGDEEVHGP